MAAVKELEDKLSRAEGAILTDYRGLDVKSIMELRRKLREAGIEYKVVKNTLALLAAKSVGIEGLEKILVGPVAIAFGYRDPAEAAKLVFDFAKAHAELGVKGGILNKKAIDDKGVKALASLPSREVLLGQVLSAMQGPLSGLVNVLSGTIRNLAYALDAVRRQKEGAEQGA